MKLSEQLSNRRAFLVAASALALSGCFGSFGATNLLYDWNKGVSDSKWLRWLVFLVLIIVPVYSLFILADALVLNTIEFFTGKNPVGGSRKLGDGKIILHTRATPDRNLVKHELEKDGAIVQTWYFRRLSAHELIVLDARQRPIARARVLDDGSVELLDGEGRVRSHIDAAQVQRAEAALERGVLPTRAVELALGPTDQSGA